MAKKVLIIDDEKESVELITAALSLDGYVIYTAHTTDEGQEQIRAFSPDVIVLDLRLPSVGGLELCRILKDDPATRTIPIIMLTTQNADLDKVLGLKTGADDYITKPFNPEELRVRVAALLRRMMYFDAQMSGALEHDGLVIDRTLRTVFLKGKGIELKRKEFELLYLLVSKKGEALTRQYLRDALWGNEFIGTDRAIDWHIAQLRAALGKYGQRIKAADEDSYRLE